MPDLVMVRYDVPDDLGVTIIDVGALPGDWQRQESLTQGRGDAWHSAIEAPLLKVPSAIVPIDGSPDLNVVINHRHPDAARIRILAAEPFTLDVRLF
jgi:hypothetical protein